VPPENGRRQPEGSTGARPLMLPARHTSTRPTSPGADREVIESYLGSNRARNEHAAAGPMRPNGLTPVPLERPNRLVA
jgi:hypothetical protein